MLYIIYNHIPLITCILTPSKYFHNTYIHNASKYNLRSKYNAQNLGRPSVKKHCTFFKYSQTWGAVLPIKYDIISIDTIQNIFSRYYERRYLESRYSDSNPYSHSHQEKGCQWLTESKIRNLNRI